MTTLVTGGSKCGKSRYGESILSKFEGRKIYIATMIPYGTDAYTAIERHRKMREGKNFQTIEKYTGIHELKIPEKSGVLLECTANLCANEMFCGSEIVYPADKVVEGIKYLQKVCEELVIITNQTGSDGVAYSESTMLYMKALGEINCRIAELSDNVVECVYGIPIVLKGVLA